tara:strand:- start:2 stop:709 length:708 start_codon:yes stop_codon:yes gene_type:complete
VGIHKVRKSVKALAPSLQYEKTLWQQGVKHIVGIDEVGKGAWAGPLTIVAAVIPRDKRIYKVRDSKLLIEAERESLYGRIGDWCKSWAAGHASNDECDELGMSGAQKLAVQRAIEGLSIKADHFLIDGKWDFVGHLVGVENVTKVIKGDTKCLSIASASVLAKVTRDRIMRDSHTQFPQYKFEDNKGYPSPQHIQALKNFGPCVIHRKSWAFMDQLSSHGISRLRRPSAQGTLFS